MTDRESDLGERRMDAAQVRAWMRGDEAAAAFIEEFFAVCHTWDDLVDRDRPVAAGTVNGAFWKVMFGFPRNPFYRAHVDALLPVMETAALNWLAANRLEQCTEHDREIAWTLRCSILDVIVATARLLDGPTWAATVAVQARRYGQRESLQDYLAECRRRFDGRENDHA